MQPSKQKREMAKITNSQNTKRIYGQPSEQLFPKRWPLSIPNRTKNNMNTRQVERHRNSVTETGNTVSLKPFSWLRFIDDIDRKLIHDRKAQEAFLESANSYHSTIRFAAEVSNDKHIFLDTTSHLTDDRVAVDLYTKPTDSRQYLLPTSCYPPHCSKNIPYSLALCIRRICSDDEVFEKRVKYLSEQLNKRGYQKQVIDKAIGKVRHLDRQSLWSYKQKPTVNKAVLTFAMAYSVHKVRDPTCTQYIKTDVSVTHHVMFTAFVAGPC